MPLVTGTKIGPYEVRSPLGAGGMGEVYRARDTRLGRDVAIKVLPEALARDTERLRRFETEARAVAALNHPNILSIHDIGEHDGAPYLVSECLEGQSLREELRGGALPLRRAVEYGTEIAQGLAAAHDKGIVHRDLKPENIFVNRDGRVKILDFGLAKLALPEAADQGATLENVPTSAGVVLGTVGYMSPEQVKGEAADARSDIFALGAILYEMVSGQRAFKRDTSAETMTAILKEDPPELNTSLRPVPPVMERIIRRCLEKKPLQRFQSARDLAFNLEGLSGSSSTSAATSAALSGAVPVVAEKQTSGLIAPLAFGVLLLLVVAAGSWIIGRRSAPVSNPAYHQLTFERGLVYSARFAGDGRTIYYSAGWNGDPVQVYSTVPDSPESRSLSLTNSGLFAVSASELAISIGCRDRFIGDCQGTLGIVPIAGGAPREIAGDVLAADWTADASEMAVIRQVEGKYRVEFPRGKVIYESYHPLGYLRIAPGGDAVAFGEFVQVFGDAGWVVALDRGGKQLLRSETFVSLEGLAWSPAGKEVWVGGSVHDGWADAIHAIGFDGKDRIVLRLPGTMRLHDVSRDGRILLSQESWRSIVRFRGPGDKQERDLSWLDYAQVADISADGSQVVFDDWGAAAGATGLAYLRKTDGSPALKLGEWSQPVLSPDGTRVLAVDASEVGPNHLALLPTGLGEIQRLPESSLTTTTDMGFTRDGKSIYYAGTDGHGWRMYFQDLSGGAPKAVTPEISVKSPRLESHLVSPDGKLIFARDLNGRGTLYPIGSGDGKLIPGWSPEDNWITWSTDGHSAYVFHDERTSASVYRIDLSSGKRELTATLTPGDAAGVTMIYHVRMTPDGKSYAYSFFREQSDLFLVQGVR